MSRVSQKEDIFYSIFRDFSAVIVKAGQAFYEICQQYPESKERIPEIKSYETQGDEFVARAMNELYTSFITPFDREDISELIFGMDSIIDSLEGVAARFDLFHIDKVAPEAIEMARLVNEAIAELDIAFQRFSNFKKDRTVIEKVLSVNKIEDEGDISYRGGLERIYDENDILAIVTWSDLLAKMEDALDACADVAGTVQAVVIKNA